jgi:hypothetical protein
MNTSFGTPFGDVWDDAVELTSFIAICEISPVVPKIPQLVGFRRRTGQARPTSGLAPLLKRAGREERF